MKTNSILFFIIIISLFLRLFNLSKLPASLNPDEAALGYNSYSLLTTAKDEHGKFMPVSLESFGDWKLPVYSYVTMIPIWFFGLNEFSVRLPSVISGVFGVWLIFKISILLFGKKKIAIFASLFYALSPWNIYFSRAAYEVNLASTFFLSGLLLFLQILYKKDADNKQLHLYSLFSTILFAITLFTYHSFIIITPIFVLSLIYIYKNSLFNKRFLFIYMLIFIVLTGLALFNSISSGSNKITTLLLFNDKDIIYNRAELLRGDNAIKFLAIEKLLHNKYSGGIYQFAQNYISSFSPDFLFDKGGEKLVHNIGSFGYLYLIDSLLIVTGIIFILRKREDAFKILLIWLFVSPIPSALTKDSPNATRLYIMMPLYVLFSANGAYYLMYTPKNLKLKLLISSFLIIMFLINFIYFIDAYFIHFNTQRSRFWRYGQREAVQLTKKYPDYQVIYRGPENFPYIYFLFYNAYSPVNFQNEVKYYPYNPEGFLYVKSFDRYSFVEKINYTKSQKRTIYIDDYFNSEFAEIILPSGDPILYYRINH